MARDDPEVRLRLPADLKARTEAAAREAGRSMNAEIVTRLGSTFLPDGQVVFNFASDAAVEGFVNALLKASNVDGGPTNPRRVQINIVRDGSDDPA